MHASTTGMRVVTSQCMKTVALQNDTLERNIEHLEERLAREASENQELLKQLHKELDSTKEVSITHRMNRCEISTKIICHFDAICHQKSRIYTVIKAR